MESRGKIKRTYFQFNYNNYKVTIYGTKFNRNNYSDFRTTEIKRQADQENVCNQNEREISTGDSI